MARSSPSPVSCHGIYRWSAGLAFKFVLGLAFFRPLAPTSSDDQLFGAGGEFIIIIDIMFTISHFEHWHFLYTDKNWTVESKYSELD